MSDFEKALEEGIKQNGGDDFESGQFENGARWAREWLIREFQSGLQGGCYACEKVAIENQRLREALEEIKDSNYPGGGERVFDIAEEALAETEGE